MTAPTIILASQSLQRRLLLETLGLAFEVRPAGIDEKAIQHQDLKLRAQEVAKAKAQAISLENPQAIIIAADTYSVLDGQALEKPESLEEAAEMLRRQSGQWTVSYTGFCFIDPRQTLVYTTATQTKALFLELSSERIQQYIHHNPVLTWSAAFSPAFDPGAALIAQVEGSLTGFTHGLPMEELVPQLINSKIIAP